MIYQPMNAHPNNTAIDGAKDNVFSFGFSGDQLLKFQIKITENGSTATAYQSAVTLDTKYNGESVQFTLPANSVTNGKTYLWYVTQWESSPSMMVTSGFVQKTSTVTNVYIMNHPAVKPNMFITINGEQRQITSYDFSTGLAVLSSALTSVPAISTSYNIHTDFITNIAAFSFRTIATPDVQFTNLLSTISSRNYTFLASYSQAQAISIKYHRWEIFDSENVAVSQSGDVYSSRLSYTFDGFIAENSYTVKLTVINQLGFEVVVSGTFDVAYPEPVTAAPPSVKFLKDKNAVEISYYDARQSFPNTDDAVYQLQDSTFFPDKKMLTITQGNIAYNTDEFDVKFVTTQFSPINDSGGIICEIDGKDISLRGIDIYMDDIFIYTIPFSKIASMIEPTQTPASGISIWNDLIEWDDTFYWIDGDKSLTEYVFKLYYVDGTLSIIPYLKKTY